MCRNFEFEFLGHGFGFDEIDWAFIERSLAVKQNPVVLKPFLLSAEFNAASSTELDYYFDVLVMNRSVEITAYMFSPHMGKRRYESFHDSQCTNNCIARKVNCLVCNMVLDHNPERHLAGANL